MIDRPTAQPDESGTVPVTLPSLIAVAAFAGASLAFHCFGGDAWVPILDSANLAIHEAGHPLVGLFSHRASVYGGTIFQLAFPLAVAVHFARSGHTAGVAAGAVWLGESLLNVGRYMADARVQALPLAGGGDHDWAEIFSRWGVLHRETQVAGLTRALALALIVGAVAWLFRRWRAESSGNSTP